MLCTVREEKSRTVLEEGGGGGGRGGGGSGRAARRESEHCEREEEEKGERAARTGARTTKSRSGNYRQAEGRRGIEDCCVSLSDATVTEEM